MPPIMDEKPESPSIDEKIGHLEDEALKRKERLKALKEKKVSNKSDKVADDLNEESAFPKPIFRNYNPNDDVLRPGVLPKPALINIEEQIKDQLENARPQALIEKEIDLATLAPQKIDWDLKREADKKLKLLEKRTQQAIAQLIRERLQKAKNPDFAELISVGTKSNQAEDEEEN